MLSFFGFIKEEHEHGDFIRDEHGKPVSYYPAITVFHPGQVHSAYQKVHEDRHYAPGVNGDWGFLTKEGKVESGLHHAGVKTHNALARKLKLGKTDHEAVKKGHGRFYVMHPSFDPHQSVQSPDSLSVEMSHKGAPNLHQHMHKLIGPNGIKPRNIIYDIAHHETPNQDHETFLHHEFVQKYGR